MADEFSVDAPALRATATELDERARAVASHGEMLDARAAAPVGRGAIGGTVESAVRRAVALVAHDVTGAVRSFYAEAAAAMRRAAAETERRDAEARAAFDELHRASPSDARADSDTIRREGSADHPREARAGHRRSAFIDLSPDEIDRVEREFREIGGDPGMLRFNTGARTGYLDGDRQIQVNGDVFPSGPPDPLRPNATMTSRAVLAHELGHHHYDVGENHPDYLAPGTPDDEMRASRWAAEYVPGLTDEERRFLVLDAQHRGAALPSDAFVRRVLYGITEDATC